MLIVCFAAVYSMSLNSPVGARSLGSLKVSEAGLGTLNLALDKAEDLDAAAALRASLEAGCNFVDVRTPDYNPRNQIITHSPRLLLEPESIRPNPILADCGGLRVWHI